MAGSPSFIWSLIDLNGTASRKRGWFFLGLFVVVEVLRGMASGLADWALIPVTLSLILLIVALVQRLHDAGRTGYWVLLALVPLLGILAMITILSLSPSDTPPRAHPNARRVGTVALVAYVALGLSRVYLWEPFWIPAESMKPTLLVGDFLIATKVIADDIARGDVVVFRHPVQGTDYIKRVIGLPGDKIQVQDGVLYINGAVAPQEAAGVFEEIYEPQGPMRNTPRCENGAVGEGGICTKSRFVETLPEGQRHNVLNIDANGPGDNTDVFTVPEGSYFVMGDNRDNSNDSRFGPDVGGPGFVPSENVRARASMILFSSAGERILYFWTWRSDRYFEAVE